MTELIAKPVLKNKYWIVESAGSKVATIQAVDNGGFVYVHENNREQFASIKLLSTTHNVKFDKPQNKQSRPKHNTVYDYPVAGHAYNIMWDLKHKFPVFSKTNKSKSFFCAGYYVVKFGSDWAQMFCPKLITLNRYHFYGPYKTEKEMQNQFDLVTNGK